MKAINHYIVIEKIKEEPRKIAGLVVTEKLDVDNRYLRGTVITRGENAKGVEEGEIVHYDKHAGHGVTWEDVLYQVIKIGDVVLVE